MTESTYDLLRQLCGLSQQEAADFHGVRIDSIKSWCSDRRSAPQGAIDELRDLYAQIRKAADTLLEHVQSNIQVEDNGDRFFRIGLPHDDRDLRVCGFPTMSTCEASIALVAAQLPAGVPVKLVPRVRGAIPTAVISNWIRRRTAPRAELLTAANGAVMSAKVLHADEGAQASYTVELHTGDSVLTQSDTKLLKTDREARAWLGEEAQLRGFGTFKTTTVDERSEAAKKRDAEEVRKSRPSAGFLRRI